jgi:hypothetical protein
MTNKDVITLLGTVWEKGKDPITMILALLAIVFAIIQFHDSRGQLKKLSEQTSKIEGITRTTSEQATTINDITRSISTRYKATFPNNLAYIIPVIQHAAPGSKIDVMADHAGYAIYSTNVKFLQYRRALEDAKLQKSRIRVLVYNRELATHALDIQFSDQDFDKEKKDNFRGFFDDRPPKPKDRAEFIRRLLDVQDKTVEDLCGAGIQVRRVPPSQKFLFFLWLNDTPEAVFAFRNEAQREREITFFSVDPDLIDIFRTVFDQTWKSADPATDKSLAGKEDPVCGALRKRSGTD